LDNQFESPGASLRAVNATIESGLTGYRTTIDDESHFTTVHLPETFVLFAAKAISAYAEIDRRDQVQLE
jgi:hypothetical protein